MHSTQGSPGLTVGSVASPGGPNRLDCVGWQVADRWVGYLDGLLKFQPLCRLPWGPEDTPHLGVPLLSLVRLSHMPTFLSSIKMLTSGGCMEEGSRITHTVMEERCHFLPHRHHLIAATMSVHRGTVSLPLPLDSLHDFVSSCARTDGTSTGQIRAVSAFMSCLQTTHSPLCLQSVSPVGP